MSFYMQKCIKSIEKIKSLSIFCNIFTCKYTAYFRDKSLYVNIFMESGFLSGQGV